MPQTTKIFSNATQYDVFRGTSSDYHLTNKTEIVSHNEKRYIGTEVKEVPVDHNIYRNVYATGTFQFVRDDYDDSSKQYRTYGGIGVYDYEDTSLNTALYNYMKKLNFKFPIHGYAEDHYFGLMLFLEANNRYPEMPLQSSGLFDLQVEIFHFFYIFIKINLINKLIYTRRRFYRIY